MTTTSHITHEDRSSLSAPEQVKVTHLDWDIAVDFAACVLKGTATYAFHKVPEATATTQLKLDTAHLIIHKVTDQVGKSLTYHENVSDKAHLGTQLAVDLNDDTTQVTIHYETTQSSSALQWLPPAQTVGKVHPYLFTQCQAIHARSLVPCQDRPGVKMTYTAKVTVPSWASCVLSAVLQSSTANAVGTTTAGNSEDDTHVFVWEQKIPISSYLLAMAVGDLTSRDISSRCAVWSEPALIDAVAYEFAQTEDFLQIAEELAGKPYVWGRYDLLCLPPSFPFGGMENPCITFVTPTLLAGDRSLADVVAHEIAHSWTGNLVTNATWDHFWLNEGWTTWFQRKIMARIHKDDRFLDFDALGGYASLQTTVNHEMEEPFTKLVLDIGDGDPDDSYSTVAYEKGFNLLYYLEGTVGKDDFEAFFKKYVAAFSSRILTSEDFRDFFMKSFEHTEAVKGIDWDKWLYEPGMPPIEPKFDRTLATQSESLAEAWIEVDREETTVPEVDISSWSSDQITCFLDHLLSLLGDKPMKAGTVLSMHDTYGFGSSKNSEILFRYSLLSIAAQDETMIDVILRFISSQGRMKFTRPIYRALFASDKFRAVAVQTFMENKDFYHPICAKMLASDLKQTKTAHASPPGNNIFRALLVFLSSLFWPVSTSASLLDEDFEAAVARKRWYLRKINIYDTELPFSVATMVVLFYFVFTLTEMWRTRKRNPVPYCVASHILVGDHGEETAELLFKYREKIGSDPEKFTKYAKKYGGGSLGKFTPGSMDPMFDQVCFDPQAPLHTVIGPVHTRFGFHLIWIEDRSPDG